MNEDIGGEDAALTDAAGDAAAWALLGRASREKADAYLDEQSSLIRLQKEHLHEQRLLQLSHLKWRRFDDQLKGALQIMLVALSAVVVLATGTAMWNASQADGLVIDAFSVPPSFAQTGLSGEVVADDMTAKLAAVRRFAMEHSFSTSKDVSKNEKDQIRVEIPDAGISISEALRYLRAWLGNERHANGNVRDLGNGQIALVVSVSGLMPVTVMGKASDLDRLEREAAEKVFGEIDPVNIVNYLTGEHRPMEAYAAAARYVPLADTELQRADSYGLWSYTTANATGDFHLAVARALTGVAIDPQIAVTHAQLVIFYSDLGWDEAALHEAEAILPLKVSDQPVAHRAHGFAEMQAYALSVIARLQGDHAGKGAWNCAHTCSYPEELLSHAQAVALQHDPTGSFRLIGAAEAAGSVDQADRAEAHFAAEATLRDWKTARADAIAGAAAYVRENSDRNPRFVATVLSVRYRPLQALAEAHLGDFAATHRTIDATPADCDTCIRVRGAIDVLETKQAAAAYWYARAVLHAPSLPFAYADWGEMLLRRGDYDAAIVKFKLANDKGPHFADPLEMCGEALMQKNRSDLALPKFEEAAKYAPNWGRLHLKWGEALTYTGQRDEAKKQIAIAGTLDLSPAEKTALAAWMKTHG